jgi:hypothetical protein
MITYNIDPLILEKYGDLISCSLIADSARARGIIRFQGKNYVATSGSFKGGCLHVELEQVVSPGKFTGKILSYGDWYAQLSDERRGSYKGILISCKGQQYVFTGNRIRLERGKDTIGKQATLFE